MGLTFSQPTPASPKKAPAESKGDSNISTAQSADTTTSSGNNKVGAPSTSADHSKDSPNTAQSAAPDSSIAIPAVKTDSNSLVPINKYKGLEDLIFLDEEKLPYLIELKPHVHTLFCERKQRVCTSVGKLQELEYVNIVRNPSAVASPQRRKSMSEQASFQQSLVLTAAPRGVWIRIFRDLDEKTELHKKKFENLEVFTATATCIKQNASDSSTANASDSGEDLNTSSNVYDWTFHYAVIAGTENSLTYQLTVQDVGCYISYRLEKEVKSRDDLESLNDTAAPSEEPNTPVKSYSNLFGDVQEESEKTVNNANPSDAVDSTTVNSSNSESNRYIILRPMGYVLPGPPRLLSFDIDLIDSDVNAKRSEDESSNVDPDGDITNRSYFPATKPLTSLIVGDRLVAKGTYIGGFEGHSEYWWLRVSDKGERSEVKLITPINENDKFTDSDPRVLVITPNDLNCEFKVKCRPIRDDNVKGEIFTSKPTPQVRMNRLTE